MTDRVDDAFEKYLIETEERFLVQVFFRALFVLGLAAELFGMVLVTLNYFQLIEISRNTGLAPMVIGAFLILFGRLGQWVNTVVEIRVHRNDDCPVCRGPGLQIELWDEIPRGR